MRAAPPGFHLTLQPPLPMQRRPADTEEEKAEEVSATSAHSLSPGKGGVGEAWQTGVLGPRKINNRTALLNKTKHLNAGEEPLLAFALHTEVRFGVGPSA